MGKYGLNREDKARIISVILARKKAEKIVLFGSRARNIFGRASDIDLAIVGKSWTDRDVNIVKNELEERIKTPLTFDIVNFYGVEKKSLKQNIAKEGVTLYDAHQG